MQLQLPWEGPPQTTRFSKFERQGRRKCTWYFCHTVWCHWFGEFYVYFDEEGCWSHPFPHEKLKSPTATRQENYPPRFRPTQSNGTRSSFDQLFTNLAFQLSWRAHVEGLRKQEVLECSFKGMFFEHHRRRSEQGNYTSIIQLSNLSHQAKGRLRRLTEQSLVTLG